IEQALRSIGAAVKLDQPVKKQALAFIHQLIDAKTIPIARARMKLRCNVPDEPSLEKLVEWCEIKWDLHPSEGRRSWRIRRRIANTLAPDSLATTSVSRH
ncbi:SBDS-like protein, partial [Trypanosoma cruzi]